MITKDTERLPKCNDLLKQLSESTDGSHIRRLITAANKAYHLGTNLTPGRLKTLGGFYVAELRPRVNDVLLELTSSSA